LVSVLPEDPSRFPPLSAHRSHNQPCDEDDAHLEAAISSWRERETSISAPRESQTDPAVRSSRREEEESLEVDEDERKNCEVEYKKR